MYCKKCGAELSDGAQFCSKPQGWYGKPFDQYVATAAYSGGLGLIAKVKFGRKLKEAV